MARFVILEHRWEGVHWDFMLEAGEALRTWALEAPIAFGVAIPARALADHRLAYLEYEGEISRGRGTVRRLDRGTYTAEVWTEDLIRVVLQGDQVRGMAELRRSDIGPSISPLRWIFRLEGKVD
ncbi:MAG: hypothetical protein IRY99_04145 [Isosphaeraceae bacterium]|nr:hypothetical protein [Isosphaeraceae bacterium]